MSITELQIILNEIKEEHGDMQVMIDGFPIEKSDIGMSIEGLDLGTEH